MRTRAFSVAGRRRDRATRWSIACCPYVEAQCTAGVPLHRMTRHLAGLFNGLPGARAWRRYLSENACRRGAGPEVLRAAAALVPPNREAA